MLQPITGETFRGASANVQEGARLDIAADGLWGGWVILRELLWTLVFSIPIQPQISTNSSQQSTESMKTKRRERMSSESER